MGWNINCSTNVNALVNIRVILVHTNLARLYSVLRTLYYSLPSPTLLVPPAKPGDPRLCHSYAVDPQSQAYSFPH